MAEEKIYAFDWKIENLSFWCDAVHGRCIQSPDTFLSEKFVEKVELYPRGGSGQDDHMEVRIRNAKSVIRGELSFIGSDGSLICSQQMHIITQGDESVVGPKFDEVVARSRKEDRKDEITLQFRIQSNSSYDQFACTTVSAIREVSIKIDSKLFESFQSVVPKELFYIRYSSEVGKGVALNIARKDERTLLMMEPKIKVESSVLLMMDMNILDKDGAPIRKDRMRHVFIDKEPWTFLQLHDLEEKGITINLSLKTIKGECTQSHNYGTGYKKHVSMAPNNMCFSKQKSLTVPVTSKPSNDSTIILKEELMCLYQDQDFSDVTLKCDDVTFPVHKAILSARSPVFKTMLSSDMREAASSEVVITDLDPSTLARFLTFLYSGAVGEEGLQVDSALNLYYAADKYQVPSLKRECSDFLCDNVSISNACDILSLGDKHRDNDLIAVSHSYILDNYSDVLGSKEWDRLMESEPMLALKTLTQFGREKNMVKKAGGNLI